jgi:hypothetical protein
MLRGLETFNTKFISERKVFRLAGINSDLVLQMVIAARSKELLWCASKRYCGAFQRMSWDTPRSYYVTLQKIFRFVERRNQGTDGFCNRIVHTPRMESAKLELVFVCWDISANIDKCSNSVKSWNRLPSPSRRWSIPQNVTDFFRPVTVLFFSQTILRCILKKGHALNPEIDADAALECSN